MSTSQPSRKPSWRFVAALLIAVAVTVFAILPAASRATNCGGNTAALSACRSYILTLELWEGQHPETIFDLDSISEDIRRDVSHLPGASWLHSGRLMARRTLGKLDSKGRKEVILVYEKPHNNVPRVTFGHAPMMHAVAFSTGETGLITPEEFARLDLTGFVDLKELQSTNPTQARDLSVKSIAATYKSLNKITPNEVIVNFELMTSCIGTSRKQLDEARKSHGPHANATVLIFMNDTAAQTFAAQGDSYPLGSVIVKQKNIQGYRDEATGKWVVGVETGVGGMVKRSPGFDATHGDWEYFYFEDPKKIESGKIASCIDCHESAKGTDHVFGSWRKKTASLNLPKVTIPQPTDAFNGMRTSIEFEGVILERLPSPRAWSGIFAWFQGVRYQVETVSSGPIKKGEHVVYHVLVGPPLCEDSEPIAKPVPRRPENEDQGRAHRCRRICGLGTGGERGSCEIRRERTA